MAWLIVVLMCVFSVGQAYGDAIDTMPTNSWYEIPGSHMDTVAYNWLPGQGLQGSVNCIMACWAGGALDTKRNILYALGGGHLGYNGNEVYGFNLSQGVLSWSRLTTPTINPNLVTLGSGDVCPSASIVAPCATHTYGSTNYDPVNDRLVTHGWQDAVANQSMWVYNPSTATWFRGTSIPACPACTTPYQGGEMGTWDSVNNLVWVRFSSYGQLGAYNVATNTWASLPNGGSTGGALGIYRIFAFDPKRNRIIVVGPTQGGGEYPNAVEILTSNPNAPVERSLATTGPKTCENSSIAGMDYDPNTDSMICWPGSGSTIYRLNLTTHVWTAITTTLSGVTPVADPNGTWGRFRYVPSRGVFVLANATNVNVQVLKLGAVVADTQAPTIPTGLTVTVISSTQINLSWNASTDNVGGSGVAGYSVRRCSPTACNPVNEVYTPTGTSQNDTGLTPNTPYGYSVAARDAAGNLSLYSPAVYATTLAAGGGADFATRCAAAGVVRCFGFDTNADLGTIGSAAVGNNFGTFNNGVSNCPTTGASRCATIDTTVKAGGAGSMKFVIPTNSGSSGAGQWFTNFGSNQLTLVPQFGSGQTFYIQWRQRFSSCYLFGGSAEPCSGPPRSYLGGGGWKIADISTGDVAGTCLPNGANCATSCSEIEIVWTTTSNRGVPQGYNGCPGTYGGLGGGSFVFEEPFGGSDFKLQNAYLISGNPGWCPYSQLVVAGNRTNCWSWTANEWLTFKVRVTLGKYQQTGCAGTEQWCYPNSTVEFWGGREGQATTKIHSYTFALNGDDTGTETEKYGKIWLLPYNTGKDSSEVTPEGYTWYDELIISTQDIADPGATIPTPGPLSVTINTNSGNNFTTSSSSAVLSGTATGPGF